VATRSYVYTQALQSLKEEGHSKTVVIAPVFTLAFFYFELLYKNVESQSDLQSNWLSYI